MMMVAVFLGTDSKFRGDSRVFFSGKRLPKKNIVEKWREREREKVGFVS
jgi:hypothetical protein